MGRRAELRGLSDDDVRAWMEPRRAAWRIALENNGIDGSVGAIVRGHNCFAGGGLQLLGAARFNRQATMGTHHHEPIVVSDVLSGAPSIGVEADPSLEPLPSALWREATYVIGHDAVGLSPGLAARCDARFGPPEGWGAATSPAMLAHLAMARLRSGHRAEGPPPPPWSAATPSWQEDWDSLDRREQRRRLGFDWWLAHGPWAVLRDWWICLPDGQTPLNAVLTCRNALSAGAHGVITPEHPGTRAARLGDRWRAGSLQDAVAAARAEGRTVLALEQGGTPVGDAVLPRRALLVAGHEQRGLTRDQLAVCDGVVSLAQWGSCNSFNVASAVGLALDAAPRDAERG